MSTEQERAEIDAFNLLRDSKAAAIERVRALHHEIPGDLDDDDRTWCSDCDVSWPCNTARALGVDGEGGGESWAAADRLTRWAANERSKTIAAEAERDRLAATVEAVKREVQLAEYRAEHSLRRAFGGGPMPVTVAADDIRRALDGGES